MNIDLESVLTGTIVAMILLTIKFLLDFRLAIIFMRYLYWLPVRNFFRQKPISISGKWEQIWESSGSKNFILDEDRHDYPKIKQFASYCYSEHIAKKVTYCMFGRIVGDYYVGDWFDKNDPLGYFGAFHLKIVDSDTMKGRWIGHSKTEYKVNGDEWKWKKIKNSKSFLKKIIEKVKKVCKKPFVLDNKDEKSK